MRKLVGVLDTGEPDLVAGIRDHFGDRPDVQMICRRAAGSDLAGWPLDRFDGIIGRFRSAEAVAAVQAAGRPAVNILGDPELGLPTVKLDDHAIGRLAGTHLTARQCRSIVAIGPAGRGYAADRHAGIAEVVPAVRPRIRGPLLTDPFGPQAYAMRLAFARLLRLPPPIGLFTIDKQLTAFLLQVIVEELGPGQDQVQLVGVHDDVALAAEQHHWAARIRRPVRQLGQQAAMTLAALFAGRSVAACTAIADPVIASTMPGVPEGVTDPLVRQVLTLVDEIADQPIGPDDLARLLGCHRRSLERRVRAGLGRSLLQVIQDRRIDQACHWLATTDLAIHTIAERVGFGSIDRFMACFKRRQGVGARVWRKQQVR